MKLKLIGIEERQLKEYIVVTLKIKDLTLDKVQTLAAKLIKTEEKDKKDDIRRILIEAHLKTVIRIAARYRGAGLTFATLIVAGNGGLIKASKNYNTEETSTFVEHAVWYIEGAIIDALIEVKKGDESL